MPLRSIDGAVNGVMCVGIDVTAQVRVRAEGDSARAEAEASRREAEVERERSSRVLAQAPFAVAVFSGPDHVFVTINEIERRLFSDRDVIGRPQREAFPEPGLDGARELLDRAYQSGEPVVVREQLIRWDRLGNGEMVEAYFDVVYHPICDAAGAVDGVLAYGVDVTEAVRARQSLESARTQAEQARAEAERANQVMNEFFARASHELRGPLAAMTLWLDVLRRGRPGQRAKAFAALERSVRRQSRLVADLLDIARGVAGKLRIEVEPVDLSEIVAATLGDLEPEAAARAVALEFVAPDEDVWTPGDRERLQQAVANLVANAIKFSAAGGRVEVGLARAGDRAEIAVRDEGHGISPAFVPLLFSAFRQEDGSLTRSHSGLGLGLAIVKQIVELHGGEVRAESAGEGRGATFTIVLPVVDADTAGGVHALAAGAGQLGGLRVLVVDDDELLCSGLTAVLAEHGAAATAVTSVRAAREALAQARYDLILCDLAMPDEDGYALLQHVRALAPADGGRTPAVALSGQARPEDRARALAVGFQEHVAKPVSPAQLVAVVARFAAPRSQ